MKSEAAYLQSILEAIRQIEQYTSVGREIFMETLHWQDAVVRRLINIGEAVKHLSPQTKLRHPEIPWRRIAALRDILTHDYMDSDYQIVWVVTQRDLPELKRAIEEILAWF